MGRIEVISAARYIVLFYSFLMSGKSIVGTTSDCHAGLGLSKPCYRFFFWKTRTQLSVLRDVLNIYGIYYWEYTSNILISGLTLK